MRYCCQTVDSPGAEIPFPGDDDDANDDKDAQQPAANPSKFVAGKDDGEEWVPIWITGAIGMPQLYV